MSRRGNMKKLILWGTPESYYKNPFEIRAREVERRIVTGGYDIVPLFNLDDKGRNLNSIS